MALAIEATLLLEFEVEPSALRDCASRICGLLPALATDLRAKADRISRVQAMVDRALAGTLAPDA